MSYNLFTLLPVDGHLSCSDHFAAMNNAVAILPLKDETSSMLLLLFSIYVGMGLLGVW